MDKEWHLGMKQKYSKRYTLIARFDNLESANEAFKLLEKGAIHKEYDPEYFVHLKEEPHD